MRNLIAIVAIVAFTAFGQNVGQPNTDFGISVDKFTSLGLGKEISRKESGSDCVIFMSLAIPFESLDIGEFHFSKKGLWKVRYISSRKMDKGEKKSRKDDLIGRFAKMGFDEKTNAYHGRERIKKGLSGNSYYHTKDVYIGIGMHVSWLFCDFEMKKMKPRHAFEYPELDIMMMELMEKPR